MQALLSKLHLMSRPPCRSSHLQIAPLQLQLKRRMLPRLSHQKLNQKMAAKRPQGQGMTHAAFSSITCPRQIWQRQSSKQETSWMGKSNLASWSCQLVYRRTYTHRRKHKCSHSRRQNSHGHRHPRNLSPFLRRSLAQHSQSLRHSLLHQHSHDPLRPHSHCCLHSHRHTLRQCHSHRPSCYHRHSRIPYLSLAHTYHFTSSQCHRHTLTHSHSHTHQYTPHQRLCQPHSHLQQAKPCPCTTTLLGPFH